MDVNHSDVILDTQLGLGLAAKRDVDAGEAIIRINTPYLVAVENAALDRVCSQCLFEKETLKKCARCKVPRYCAISCQEAAWKSIHHKECSGFKSLPDVLPTAVRAVMQILLQHPSGRSLDPKWADLVSHEHALRTSERWDTILLEARAAVEYTKSPPEMMEVAIALLCRMTCNAFRLTLADDTPIGLCFEPIIARANHSCYPNAAITFDGRRISLRTLVPIKKGQQIFISYIDPTQSRTRRQEELQSRYFFKCACEKCVNDDSPYQTFLKSRLPLSDKFNLLFDEEALTVFATARIAEENSNDQTEQAFKKALLNLESYVEARKASHGSSTSTKHVSSGIANLPLPAHPPYATPPIPTALQGLYLHHLSASRYLPALILSLFHLFNCTIYLYPSPSNPVLTTRLFTIARLLKAVASAPTAELTQSLPFLPEGVVGGIDYISAVHAALVLVQEGAGGSHGAETQFMREVEEELQEVEGVQGMRGAVGEVLKMWQGEGRKTVEGERIARRLFGDLRRLAGYALQVIEKEAL